jgi:hypothetical protein
VIHQRRQIAVAFADAGLDNAVVQRPGVAAVSESDRVINFNLGDRRHHMRGRFRLRGSGRFRLRGRLRYSAICQANGQSNKRETKQNLDFGHDATFQNELWDGSA